ncbi:Hypothetical predicted protein [Octopus vulgaris]|uniref:Uncharacterized protein n=1 Tax=Octopus vulgaris TaxID=6645 RepID=A0AA36EZJ9_OCTVU|nr:Hypothetical predicted protein [Octopus vulgaris]
MKSCKLSNHLKKVHIIVSHKPKESFEALSPDVSSSSSKLKSFLVEKNHVADLITSYKIVHLFAKQGRPHTLVEELIKPAILEALKVANISNPEAVIASIPLSNSSMSSRITDIAIDIKTLQDLRNSKFFL